MITSVPDEIIESDVLIIGAGLAGCSAAIKAKTSGNKVVLVDKSKVAMGGQSCFAAGIFAVFFPDQDNLETWMKETIEWGEYLNDQEWVKLLWERNTDCVMELDSWGTSLGHNIFEKKPGGAFVRRRSRGHLNTYHSVVNSLPMMETLSAKCKERGVRAISRVMITHLIRDEGGQISGAIGISPLTGKIYHFKAKAVVLSASGASFRSVQLGHKNHSGDLQAAAYRIGCTHTGMENSSSNTNAKDYDITGLNLFVSIGGKFVNRLGEEFMWDYNPVLGSRAKQTELPIAFCQEVAAGRGPIYLDMSEATAEDQALCRRIVPEAFATFDIMETQSALSAGQIVQFPAMFEIRTSNALAYRIVKNGISGALMYAPGEVAGDGSKGSLLDNKFHSSDLGTNKAAWSALAMKPVDSGDVSDHPYQAQFEAFFSALAQGKEMPLTSLNDAIISHEAVFAADRSAELGRPVKMSELK